MLIGGLQKFSLIDYPDHLSAVVFTQGCNFRCHFCYNPMLVLPREEVGKLKINTSDEVISSDEKIEKVYPQFLEDDLFDFLRSRKGKLDAVVLSGGEPTLHPDLPDLAAKIRQLGFKIKLDTNGTNPEMLLDLIAGGLLDYIAMDIKAAPARYDLAVGIQPDLSKIGKSVKLIIGSGLPYEFRTTAVPELLAEDDIRKMGEMISGAEKWWLQNFKSDTDLVNESFKGAAGFKQSELERFAEVARQYVRFCGVR